MLLRLSRHDFRFMFVCHCQIAVCFKIICKSRGIYVIYMFEGAGGWRGWSKRAKKGEKGDSVGVGGGRGGTNGKYGGMNKLYFLKVVD